MLARSEHGVGLADKPTAQHGRTANPQGNRMAGSPRKTLTQKVT